MTIVTRENFKELYFNGLKQVGVRSCNVRIGAGAALLLYGLRDSTADIDVAIPVADFNRIASSMFTISGQKQIFIGGVLHHIDIGVLSFHPEKDHVDTFSCVHPDVPYPNNIIRVDIPLEIYKLKKKLNRPKDKDDLKKLHQFMYKNAYSVKGYNPVIQQAVLTHMVKFLLK